MSLVSKAFSDIITFSRSSNATRVGPTGRVEYAPHNLCLQSEAFATTWSSFQAVTTSNVAAAPNGTITADQIAATASPYGVQFQAVAVTAGATHTFSVYIKTGTISSALFGITDTTDYSVTVNLSAGTIGTPTAGSTATITSVGNGWYRVAITRTTAAASISVFVGPNASSGNVLAWGAQLSVGPYPLDYTPTTSAAVYGPRFDYDPVTLAARGLLVEEQRTNLVTYSEDFTNAAWAQSFLTENITANSTTSPSGQVNADTIADSVINSEFAVGQSVSVTANVPYTFSVFAKANGSNFLYLRYYGNIEQYYYIVIFDLSLGTATKSQIGSSASSGSNTITSVGNGWYRLTVTATVNSGTLIPMIGIAASGTDTIGTFGNISVNGTGNRSCYLWGAQLE